jgi:hypothetical protein
MVSPPAFATTKAELDQALNTFMTVLPGEFDSGAQLRTEQTTITPEDSIRDQV